MVDLIYFLICVFGMCFFSILLGYEWGVKDGYRKAKKQLKPVLNMIYGSTRFNFQSVDTDAIYRKEDINNG